MELKEISQEIKEIKLWKEKFVKNVVRKKNI